MRPGNVRHTRNDLIETALMRNAVSRVIGNIQASYDPPLTDAEVADSIDVSSRTIFNARNMETDLSPLFLMRLAQVYGGHFLNPVLALSGGHYVENEPTLDPEILVAAAKLIEWYGRATHPDSPGGERVIHCEILEGAPHAEHVRRLSAGIVERARQIREG